MRKVRDAFLKVIKIDNSLLPKLPKGASLNRDARHKSTGIPKPSPLQVETAENLGFAGAVYVEFLPTWRAYRSGAPPFMWLLLNSMSLREWDGRLGLPVPS